MGFSLPVRWERQTQTEAEERKQRRQNKHGVDGRRNVDVSLLTPQSCTSLIRRWTNKDLTTAGETSEKSKRDSFIFDDKSIRGRRGQKALRENETMLQESEK